MTKKDKPPKEKRKRGRPETQVLKLDCTPEFLAKCIATPIKRHKKLPDSANK